MVIRAKGQVMDGNDRNVLPDRSHRVIRGNELIEGSRKFHLKTTICKVTGINNQ